MRLSLLAWSSPRSLVVRLPERLYLGVELTTALKFAFGRITFFIRTSFATTFLTSNSHPAAPCPKT